MYAGVALYLFAHVAFRWRNVRSVNVQRVVAAIVVLLLIWPASELPALVGARAPHRRDRAR